MSGKVKVNSEPTRISSHPTYHCPYLGSLNGDDTAKDFYMDIVTNSLQSAYDKYGPSIRSSDNKFPRNTVKSVVVVGAGLAGLSAAFELEKEGFDIQVLELQNRVGGRIKTFREEFSAGLVVDGGAMRIHLDHYLPNGYIKKFDISVRPFISKNQNAYLYIDGGDKIRLKDWESDNRKYSDMLFPGWNSNLDPAIEQDVKGILDLYSKTMEPVKDELYEQQDISGGQAGWEAWMAKWSKITFGDFLVTNFYSETSPSFRPWPQAAISGLKVTYSIPDLNLNLVEVLRNDLGEWWTGEQRVPTNGMDTISSEFTKYWENCTEKTIDLGQHIKFGIKVRRVVINDTNKVDITYCDESTGQDNTITADAVIIAVPLPILKQMDIDVPTKVQSVIDQSIAFPSTKILIQCKTRFWETEVGHGGSSKTNLPICQLFYPSQNDVLPYNEKGMLVCYTFDQYAMEFGTQTNEEAVERAVSEIAKIHKEVKENYEVGIVQDWFKDEGAQSVYACLPPNIFWDGLNTLMTPHHPIYLAGDAVSYTNGWMQGALESGLNAAFHLFSNVQHINASLIHKSM